MPPRPSTSPRLAATAALLGGLIALWRWPGAPLAIAFASVTAALWLLAFLAPRAYAPVHRVFEKLIQLLLAVFTYTLLGLVYFFLFTPVGLFLRLRRREPFPTRLPATEDSFWQKPPTASHSRAQY